VAQLSLYLRITSKRVVDPLELIIETVDGDPIYIIKDLEKIAAEKNEN
jgi:hypothetical protein